MEPHYVVPVDGDISAGTLPIVLVDHHHHHHHHHGRRADVPVPLFAGRRRDGLSASSADPQRFSSASRPIGARYTYNWSMWNSFGIGVCIRCTAGWLLCVLVIFLVLVILWLVFGVLWICVFSSNFCDVRS